MPNHSVHSMVKEPQKGLLGLGNKIATNFPAGRKEMEYLLGRSIDHVLILPDILKRETDYRSFAVWCCGSAISAEEN